MSQTSSQLTVRPQTHATLPNHKTSPIKNKIICLFVWFKSEVLKEGDIEMNRNHNVKRFSEFLLPNSKQSSSVGESYLGTAGLFFLMTVWTSVRSSVNSLYPRLPLFTSTKVFFPILYYIKINLNINLKHEKVNATENKSSPAFQIVVLGSKVRIGNTFVCRKWHLA